MSNRETTRELIRNELTGYEYTLVRHRSGLDILVWQTEGYSVNDVLFGTKYGSVNNRFRTRDDADFTEVPEGIAHFLEHKLFENEDCDAFEQYAKTGASANAYTSFDRTCYLFSCTDNFRESLKILLDFVQKPYFTQENVDKEQGIIAQEIKMVNDNPGNRVFYNMLKCLYHNHPVKVDIAGTVDSIAKITPDLLYKCYRTFYNLHNMVLAVAGDVDIDEIIEIADSCLKECEDADLVTSFPDEPLTVVCRETRCRMQVGMPVFSIGFKSAPCEGMQRVKAELCSVIASSLITDPASSLYTELMAEGLINSSFSADVFDGDGYFTIIFSGESNDPDEVYRRICREVERICSEGFDRDFYENIRKYTYGSAVRELSSSEAKASIMLTSYFGGTSPFDSIEYLTEMTYEDVMQCFRERLVPELSALSVVEK